MTSRRNLRVKVMQTLYTIISLEKGLQPEESLKLLQKHFDSTRELFVHLNYFLIQTALYAETDAHIRAAKHLPTKEDLHVNTKLAGNRIIWKILEDESWKKAVKELKPGLKADKELIKKAYMQLTAMPEYIKYINIEGRDNKEEREILELILEVLMLNNEAFLSHIEENFTNWDDDGDMIIQLTLSFLQKPDRLHLHQFVPKDKLIFAQTLLQTVIEKKDYLLEMIKPKLKNWDSERIAQIDMILMQMGVAEFLYFETIPPKVTINEYIDLAKEYSTPQSGHFVNGILDNIHKELVQAGKMTKVDFKKGKTA